MKLFKPLLSSDFTPQGYHSVRKRGEGVRDRLAAAVESSGDAIISRTLGALPGQLRVLHVEDNDLDAELVAQALRKGGFSISVRVVQSEVEFERQLRLHTPDIVLADYNLPQWQGMEAVEVLRREGLDIPLILVSGALGDITAVECIKRGATDYVLKDGLARLPEAIRRALQERRVLRLRRQAEEDLARKTEELSNLGHLQIFTYFSRKSGPAFAFFRKGTEVSDGEPNDSALRGR